MTSNLSTIYIVGDDAIANLRSCFVLQNRFPHADVRFFTDPELVLQRIENGASPLYNTLIVLDIQTRGISWRVFLERFELLGQNLKNRFSILLTATVNAEIASNLLLPFPKVCFVEKPITNSTFENLAPKKLWDDGFARLSSESRNAINS